MIRSDTAVVAVGQLVQQAVTLISGILIARMLGASGYGIVNLLRNLFGSLGTISPLGLDLALLKYCGRNDLDAADVRATIRRLRIVALAFNVAVASALSVGFGGILQRDVFQYPDFQLLLVITALGLPIAADIAISSAIYKARGRPGTFALMTLYLQPAARIVLIGLASVFAPTVLAVVCINTIQVAVSLVGLWVVERREFRPLGPAATATSPWPAARGVLRESLWMAANLLVYSTMRFVDVILLGLFVAASEVGSYGALSTVAQLVQVYPLAASQTLGPTVARAHHAGDAGGVRRALGDYIHLASVVSGFMFGGIAVFGDRLDLVFGQSFHFRPEVCFLMPLGYLLSATLAPTGYALSMTGRHRAELAILCVGGAALVGIGLALIPRYGQVGAAAAVALSFLIVNVIRFIYVARVLGFVPGAARDLVPPVAALALAYGSRLLLDRAAEPTLVLLVVECLLYSALYLAACLGLLFTPVLRRRFLRGTGLTRPAKESARSDQDDR